ncbi:MAG: FAD-dependent oxidoreductase [Acidobacteriaceae bacterium]
MHRARHVAIAGGGVIGLACALALRGRGMQVTVLEAGEAVKEASWAAGGMLAVEDPENPLSLLPFSRFSRVLYSQFLQVVEELSGQHVLLRTQQTVQVVDAVHASSAGVRLSPDEARSLVPGLQVTHHNYLLLEEASLDPRELCTALRSAVVAAGVALHEQERVLSVDSEGKDVLLSTARRAMGANAFVNCCGSWAASLNASAEITPCKGQMLVVAQPEGPRLTRVLRSPDVYLIPRGDGRIVIGATIEQAGYSRQVDPTALSLLRQRAAALWPPAAEAPELESWAGLRPASADGLPSIGRCERTENPGGEAQFIAAGHYRNGILLAPGTAHAIADLVSGVAPAVDLAPFAPLRASLTASCDKHFAAAL